MADLLEDIRKTITEGDYEDKIKELTQRAIDEGYEGNEIVDSGLVAGIEDIGKMWKQGQAFIPEVVRAAEVMRAGMSVIREKSMAKINTRSLGKVIIGTVKGDVHAIGKSLVRVMMEAVGFTVEDLGVDVATKEFVEAIKAKEAEIVAVSALLTTTMPQMEQIVKAVRETGLKVKIMVGGAPVTNEYANSIGADGYASDAISAVDKAKELLQLVET